MAKRASILAGMGGGLLWGLALFWLGTRADATGWPAATIVAAMLLPPGLVLIAMIGRLAQRRFFDDGIIDGQPFTRGSAAEIDQRVLSNTAEQTVLALCIWPIFAALLPASERGAAAALGPGFAVARLTFWGGYHLSPPLRGFGFAATFYPTILAALWTLWLWLS